MTQSNDPNNFYAIPVLWGEHLKPKFGDSTVHLTSISLEMYEK